MILFGVRRHPGDDFTARCLPSITRYGGTHARVLTATSPPDSDAFRSLLIQSADVQDYRALALLDAGLELNARGFREALFAALPAPSAGMQTPTMVCWPLAEPEIADGFAAFDPAAACHLAAVLDQDDPTVGHDGPLPIAAWRRWAARHGVRVVELDRGLSHADPSQSATERLAQVVAATRQGTWARRISASARPPSPRTGSAPATPERDVPALGDEARDEASPQLQDGGRDLVTACRLPELAAPYVLPERPELLLHIPETARRVLVAGPDPAPAAGIIEAAIGSDVTALLTAAHFDDNDRVWAQASAGGPFDVIVLADALGHALDPAAAWRRFFDLLAADGVLVASFPNAKHWSHVLPLLFEDRTSFGGASLMRRTAPVRLFTLLEIMDLADQAGLSTYDVSNATRLPGEDPEALVGLLSWLESLDIDPTDARTLFTSYHYVVVADRAEADHGALP